MVYAVCLAGRPRNGTEPPPLYEKRKQQAALICACLFALHPEQIWVGRFGRMYSLGVFLAGLTAWLLLRALHAKGREPLWWSAYGLTVAAFCYTHNYAFFTILAQTLFFGGAMVARWRRTALHGALPSIRGFVFAGFIAFLLYLPWLPVLWSQMREVRRNYWIPPISFPEAERVFFAWGTGIKIDGGELEMHLWLGLVVLAVFWTVWRDEGTGGCFLLQALIPWFCALGISILTKRSIFVERYFAFANLAFVAWLAMLWRYLPSARERVLFSCLFLAASCYGLWHLVSGWSAKPPAIELAARFLRDQYQEGDLIVVEGAVEVNRLRCYADRAGIDRLDVRTTVNAFARDLHMSHQAALVDTDILAETPKMYSRPERLWRGGSDRVQAAPPEGMKTILEQTFEGGGGTRYVLILHAKSSGSARRISIFKP